MDIARYTHGMPDTSYVALTRIVKREGVEYSEGIVVPADAAGERAMMWESASALAVDRWETTLRPPGSDQTEASRVDELLRELGWERVTGRHAGRPIPVRRIAARFHTGTVIQGSDTTIMIMNLDGDIVDSVPADEHLDSTLTAHGWRSHGQAEGWQAGTLNVSAFDWPQILQRLRRSRDETQAAAAEAERRLRLAIREALSAGVAASDIAGHTQLSRPRIYQIRDNRR